MYLKAYLPEASHASTPSTLFPIPVPCGPGQAIEQVPELIRIDEYLHQGHEEILYLRVYGDSMFDEGAHEVGIYDGDLLVCRNTNVAQPGDIVVAEINGESTVKRLKEHARSLYLVPKNAQYHVRKVTEADEFRITAVVMFIIHEV